MTGIPVLLFLCEFDAERHLEMSFLMYREMYAKFTVIFEYLDRNANGGSYLNGPVEFVFALD